MSWFEPTVPLSFHDSMVASLQNALAMEREKSAALTERLLSLKMAGAVEVPKIDHSTTYAEADEMIRAASDRLRKTAEPDELRALIDVHSGGNLRKRGMMLKQLAADRASGVSDEAIEAAIVGGVSGNGVPG